MNDVAERAMMDADRLEQVTEIVAAYVSHNALSPTDLPKLIAETHRALQSLSGAVAPSEMAALQPAIAIKRSITPDFIICLDDGKKFKSMKRHLAQLGMTPDEYRTKWGLPADYPMVASNYSATRSALAKSIGLGRKPAAEPVVSAKTTKKPKTNA